MGGARNSVGNSYDDREHVIEGDQLGFVDPAYDPAALFPGHGGDFIDHYLSRRFQAVALVRFDKKRIQRRIGNGAGQQRNENAIRRLEPVRLNNDGRAPLACCGNDDQITPLHFQAVQRPLR